MNTRLKRRFTCRQRHKAQAGFASLLALLELVVLLGFALGLSYFAQTGWQNSEDYLEETNLRLAATSAVERAGMAFEQNAALDAKLPLGENKRLSTTTDNSGKYRIVITALHADAKTLYLIGGAFDDAPGNRHKIVKGLWQKEGTQYVFQGWTP